jgi:ABC-2 type transport system permease protein
MQPFHLQMIDLTLIQLTNWRWSWRSSITISMLAPLFLILAFGVFAESMGPDALGYVLTGNMVFALLMEGVSKVSGHIMFMRINGTLDYFASLPMHRLALILSTVVAFLLLALPSFIVTLFVGALLLNIPLHIHPLIVIVVPLISASLSGLGTLIGLLGRNPSDVGSFSSLVSLFLFGFGPVLIPAERLPDIMNTLSLLSPATYAASALRQVVLGLPDRLPLWLDMLVLMLVTVGLLWLVNRRIDWRGRD